MPRLNLLLNASVVLDTDNIVFNQSLLAADPKLGTKAQRKALHCIFSNVGKYQSQPLLFSTRNQANPPAQYNPHAYGHKPLVAVIKQLRNNGMLRLETGTPWYSKTEDGGFAKRKLSSFKPSEKLIELCQELGYTERSVKGNLQQFLELRSLKGKLLPFEATPYTERVERLMSEYCSYLNNQKLEVDDEDLGHIHLIRKYKDWDRSGRIIHGGRTHHPFMSFPPAKRRRIKINGKAVTAVDYPASQTNVLYKHFTGRFLYPEDPYEVDGLHRDTVKYLVSMMLNNGSRRGAAMAAGANINQLTKTRQERLEIGIKHFGGLTSVMRAIEDRNAPISKCFYQGKAQGQYYAWLESNLVFEVVRHLVTLDVPALTVHDEFIVPKEMEDTVLECRYSLDVPSYN
jgi:hypothetical protein